LGVLYTGYLDKKNPVSGGYNQRFAVLTHESLHWFKRSEGYDLFGVERGHIQLADILATNIVKGDTLIFDVCTTDNKVKTFKASSESACEEWVTAVRSAIKLSTQSIVKRGLNRRSSLTGIKNFDFEDDEGTDVDVSLISHVSAAKQTEAVIARQPDWERLVIVSNVREGDELLISLSNGGIVRLTYTQIMEKSENQAEFDAPVTNVSLLSSLRVVLGQETVDLSGRASNGKASRFHALVDVAVALTTKRSTAINLVLSLMVMVVALSSAKAIGVDTTLLFMFAFLLGAYNFNTILQGVYSQNSQGTQSVSIRMILKGHTFTSPDAPAKEPEHELPQRFIDGCDGDMKEARRRWDITRHWRESEGVNTVLNQPQPHFNTIKALYPHGNCSRGKQGHVCFWERPGDFQGDQMAGRGIRTDELVRHWIFCTEYQWQILCEGNEMAKSIAVLDVNGIGMADMAGSNMDYIKKTVGIANQHYPERSYVIFVINAPWVASLMWKLVKPLVHENTQRKVRILSPKETFQGLLEHIDIDQIPIYYGGKLDYGGKDSCRFKNPDQLAMDDFVRRVNAGETNIGPNTVPFNGAAGAETLDAVQDTHTPISSSKYTNTTNAPPGKPGDNQPGDLANPNPTTTHRRGSQLPTHREDSPPASPGVDCVSPLTIPTVMGNSPSPVAFRRH
jgi:hypothetical protein